MKLKLSSEDALGRGRSEHLSLGLDFSDSRALMAKSKLSFPKPAGVKLLDKAFTVLNTIGESRNGLSATQVSQQLKLPASTAVRILQGLRYHGFVDQDSDTDRYHLGSRILVLARNLTRSTTLVRSAMPMMRQLSDQFDESVHLAAMTTGGQAMYLHTEQGRHMLRMQDQTGLTVPMHSTAAGKMLLSLCQPEEVINMVGRGPLRQDTRSTITDVDQLLAALEKIRKQGYALDIEERSYDVRCVAAPILGVTEYRHACISVSGPSSRIKLPKNRKLIDATVQTVREISEKLGVGV